jgi:Fe-Mn family superoxide dismutase
MKNLQEVIDNAVSEALFESGINNHKDQIVKTESKQNTPAVMSEAYVTQAGKFELSTELLSSKTKKSHKELLEGYIETLNKISSSLDGVDKSSANLNQSAFRSLKVDETYNHNAAFLHGLYFENISDLNSTVSVDSISYMRLARDFGTFDAWQEDFVACCMSARNGWAVTFYNVHLQRYMNTVIDLHSQNVMTGMIPVIVMDCWEHSYYRDYLKDRKSYVFGMMKELNWGVIDKRVKKSDAIAKILKG